TSVAVPLVPLSEENEDAMDHEVFQKLLKKVGIRPPADEQESFWRISANLNVMWLRKIASAISLQDGGGEAMEQGDDVGADQRSEALRALVMARERNATPTKADNDESEDRTKQAHEPTSGSDSDTKRQVTNNNPLACKLQCTERGGVMLAMCFGVARLLRSEEEMIEEAAY
ncbi:hypothetical protein scyTo_0023626, partial [Scyliorhinus torazame]|nr:hypothetical protein [Scyliorhinus torazame]